MSSFRSLMAAIFIEMATLIAAHAQQPTPVPVKPTVDADGTIRLPAIAVPFSLLASAKAKQNLLDNIHAFAEGAEQGKDLDINAGRKLLDERLYQPDIRKLRAVFPVTIQSERMGGVSTDVIEPAGGVAARNRRRVLLEFHGGGFEVGAGLGGQVASIPIASLGRIRVISVDYREAPEYKFPAASEDVAAIYRELLKKYPAKNIGLYGCSAGGWLTAESVAWFQTHGLPKPGAIGIFGAGALVPEVGDSNYFGSMLLGDLPSEEDAKKFTPYFDVPELNIKDPLVSPVYSPSVLAAFPPALLISGTRDFGLSAAVYTHSQLVKQGIEADLHVWEGAMHCSFGELGVIDPSEPETQEAWDVIVKFFDKHLGK